ncbi:MAG TPA: YceI family protein [Salinisphaeraceae bacterium]|nr:YceI family protein [Salinisphaeraceae bacterium]
MQSSGKLWSGLLLFSLLGLLAGPVIADNMRYALDPTHTQVSVHWDHLGFSNPGAYFVISEGTLIWNNEDPSESSIKVKIPVHRLTTQVPALDKLLKSDFFEADEYPTITFASTRVERIGQSDDYRIAGDLTVHGITRPVMLHATLNRIGEHPLLQAPAIGFDAKATIKRSEFGMEEYVPMVSDLVQIRITGEGLAPEALAKELAGQEAMLEEMD